MAVGGTTGVAVGNASVGKADTVLVAWGAGRVGVLKVNPDVGEAWVDIACTVSAAAVKTRLGSSVAGALEGRLHAASKNRMMNKMETKRALLYILDLLISSGNFTPRTLL